MKSLVSIIIPTFNRAHLIRETLQSVINQTYYNWECIIVDDRSTDSTMDILSNYSKKDDRFKIIVRPEKETKGAASCRNIALRIAKGEYIQFLDSDDLIESNKFESQLKCLKDKDNLTLSTCKWGRLDPGMSVPKKYDTLPIYKDFEKALDLLEIFGKRFNFFPLHTYLTPRHLIDKAGKWDDELTVNDDGEFFSRILFNANKIIFAPDTYAIYRSGSGVRLSQIQTKKQIEQYIKSWKKIDLLFNNQPNAYTAHAKTSLFHRIKKKHPNLITENAEFFKDRRKFPSHIYYKIVNRIKQL